MKKRSGSLAFLALSGAAILVLVGCGNQEKDKTLTLGNNTELSGLLRVPTFGKNSPGAADHDVNLLISGYSTVVTNQKGDYVWDEKVTVKSKKETINADGTKTYEIEINDNLKFSDGSKITAANFLVRPLAYQTAVASEATKNKVAPSEIIVGGVAYFEQKDGTVHHAGLRLLGEHKFSVTIAADYIPYFYDLTYAGFSPEPIALWAGDAVVKDDGDGAYLSGGNFWHKTGEHYDFAATMVANVNDNTAKFPFSGPYVIANWDASTKTATLTLNKEYLGNFEGVKPTLEKITYKKVISETQMDAFKKGEIDVLAGITGGDETKAAIEAVNGSNGKFAYSRYSRAGYGKLGFRADFGPALDVGVRQAVAYTIDRPKFARDFTGGFGKVVHGPYYDGSWQYQQVSDQLKSKLNEYAYSLDEAKKAVVSAGYVFGADGKAYTSGVRYRKLTTEEAKDTRNTEYAATDNSVKTEKVGSDYYMPLVLNWLGTTPNPVTDQLTTDWKENGEILSKVGLKITRSDGDFTKLITELTQDTKSGFTKAVYSVFNFATGFNSAAYDFSWNWRISEPYFSAYSACYVKDEFDYYSVGGVQQLDEKGEPLNVYDQVASKLHLEDVVEDAAGFASVTIDGVKYDLGMDALSFAMVYNTTPVAGSKYKSERDMHAEWWKLYIQRWNSLMPEVPLYSNEYFDLYNTRLQNFVTNPYWSPVDQIPYITVK